MVKVVYLSVVLFVVVDVRILLNIKICESALLVVASAMCEICELIAYSIEINRTKCDELR